MGEREGGKEGGRKEGGREGGREEGGRREGGREGRRKGGRERGRNSQERTLTQVKGTYVLLMVTFSFFFSVSCTMADSFVTSSITCGLFRTKSPFT